MISATFCWKHELHISFNLNICRSCSPSLVLLFDKHESNRTCLARASLPVPTTVSGLIEPLSAASTHVIHCAQSVHFSLKAWRVGVRYWSIRQSRSGLISQWIPASISYAGGSSSFIPGTLAQRTIPIEDQRRDNESTSITFAQRL